MAKQPKYWIGDAPASCDICERPIKTKFVDGRTRMGPWANMCWKCYQVQGLGLGLGNGQEYTQQADKRWLKTRG